MNKTKMLPYFSDSKKDIERNKFSDMMLPQLPSSLDFIITKEILKYEKPNMFSSSYQGQGVQRCHT